MAKGNLFISNGSGKVGNVVLSVSKGQQITKVYQPKVTNPRSYAQQLQRARFANAVKFYKKGTLNFFKFAFEDKRQNESDFNAFMRHNVANSTLLKYDQVKSDFYPALGNWQLTQGRLSNVIYKPVFDDDTEVYFRLPALPESDTVGDISKVLVADGSYISGDIITFVYIGAPAVTSLSTDLSSLSSSPVWGIYQFIVNVDDNTPISDIAARNNSVAPIDSFLDNQTIVISPVIKGGMAWAACIHSRKSTNGLYVSTEYLTANAAAKAAMAQAKGSDYELSVAESWKSGTEAILAGGVADPTGQTQASDDSSSSSDGSSTAYANVTAVNGNNVPYSIRGQKTGGTINYTLTGTNMIAATNDQLTVVTSSGGTISATISATSETEATLTVVLSVTDDNVGIVGSVALRTGKQKNTLLIAYVADASSTD